MTITVVRVTRTYEQTVTEYVDVEVIHDDSVGDYTIETNAKTLIEAKIACGQDIGWEKSHAKMKDYPRERLNAEIMGNSAPSWEPEIPAPPPVPLSDLNLKPSSRTKE